MSTANIRKRLHEFIRFANEKKVKALYTIIEEDIKENQDVWSKEFANEMKRRTKDVETGKVRSSSKESVSKKARALLLK